MLEKRKWKWKRKVKNEKWKTYEKRKTINEKLKAIKTEKCKWKLKSEKKMEN